MSDFGDQMRAAADVAGYDVPILFWAGVADEQASRVDRVLALHHPTDAGLYFPLQVCDECFGTAEWPCETVRILRGDE